MDAGIGGVGSTAPSSQPLDGGQWEACCAAAVAAPIRRLCVLYLEVSYPHLSSRSFRMALIALEMSGRPVWK